MSQLVVQGGEGGVNEGFNVSINGQDNLDTILVSFTENLEQFLEQICAVWPECNTVREYSVSVASKFTQDQPEAERKQAAVELLRQWHDQFQNYYTYVSQEREDLFALDIGFFNQVAFQSKWAEGLHPDTQTAIWEYLKNLCNLSNMYSIYTQVPDNLMSTIQRKAMRLAENISQGEIGLHNLNVEQLASEILTDVNMEDLQNFAFSITNGGQDIGRIQDMCGSLMSMMGNQMDISSLFPAGK
jgi:hypothetical protein